MHLFGLFCRKVVYKERLDNLNLGNSVRSRKLQTAQKFIRLEGEEENIHIHRNIVDITKIQFIDIISERRTNVQVNKDYLM